MKSNIVETIIGAGVIVIAVVFFTYLYKAADVQAGTGGYRVIASFDSIDGVSVGSDVRVAGIKVGSVVEQRLDTDIYEAAVVFAIKPGVKLPTDSSAKVTSEGLLGDRYVAIEPGGDDTMLSEGGIIQYTQGPIDLMSIIGEFVLGGKDKKEEEDKSEKAQ